MEEFCLLCGKELEKYEREFCESCFNIMKYKYPKNKNFERRLKCHKKYAKRPKGK